MRPDQRPPNTPEAQAIEEMKRLGLVEVRPEDRDKPWADQRLRKTPAGEEHERTLAHRAALALHAAEGRADS